MQREAEAKRQAEAAAAAAAAQANGQEQAVPAVPTTTTQAAPAETSTTVVHQDIDFTAHRSNTGRCAATIIAYERSFLPEITYMRGLCMLGVIGIHVGSYALQNPFVNLQLISVLEILSRFAVPAFSSFQRLDCFIIHR